MLYTQVTKNIYFSLDPTHDKIHRETIVTYVTVMIHCHRIIIYAITHNLVFL